MTIRKYHLAVAGAALTATLAVGACGSGPAQPATNSTPQPSASTPASTTASAADVAFATGMLRLENQAAALAALVPAHTTTAQVRQFAASLNRHAAEFSQMGGMLTQWGHPAPAPYTPGSTPPAGAGPGMLGSGDWDEMGHLHGTDFNDHFADAMIANRTAEVALCRAELARGASPQARALARTMLAERQAELSQIQAWQSQWEHDTDHDMMHG